MGFSRQECWSGLPCPPPGDLPNPGIEPTSPMAPAVQAGSSPLSHRGSPFARLLVAKCSGSQGLSYLLGCQGWPTQSSPSISPSTWHTLQCTTSRKFLSTDHRGLEICFSAYPLKPAWALQPPSLLLSLICTALWAYVGHRPCLGLICQQFQPELQGQGYSLSSWYWNEIAWASESDS